MLVSLLSLGWDWRTAMFQFSGLYRCVFLGCFLLYRVCMEFLILDGLGGGWLRLTDGISS